MTDVYLLLGSNLGDKEMWLEKARILISDRIGAIDSRSSLYQTASWGNTGQPDYINQVLMVKTDTSAHAVLKHALEIEKALGRKRTEKWGARIIDIDILFYGDTIIESPELTLPHPHLHERRFTLEPLKELAPGLQHPVLKKTIRTLYNALTDKLAVNQIKN